MTQTEFIYYVIIKNLAWSSLTYTVTTRKIPYKWRWSINQKSFIICSQIISYWIKTDWNRVSICFTWVLWLLEPEKNRKENNGNQWKTQWASNVFSTTLLLYSKIIPLYVFCPVFKRNVGSYLRINGCVHHDVPIFTSKNLGKKISHYVG